VEFRPALPKFEMIKAFFKFITLTKIVSLYDHETNLALLKRFNTPAKRPL